MFPQSLCRLPEPERAERRLGHSNTGTARSELSVDDHGGHSLYAVRFGGLRCHRIVHVQDLDFTRRASDVGHPLDRVFANGAPGAEDLDFPSS